MQLLEDWWSESRRGRELSCVLLVNNDVFGFLLRTSVGALVAASGGGQLHHTGEKFWPSLEEFSSWLGWTARRSIHNMLHAFGLQTLDFYIAFCHWPGL